MSRRTQADMSYQAGLEEHFLMHIGHEYTELICEELDNDIDKWADIEIPESMDIWFDHFFKSHKVHRRKIERKNQTLKTIKWAAVIVLIIFAVNYVLVANVEAYRLTLLNTLMKIQEKFTQIDIDSNEPDTDAAVPKDWEGRYYPAYVPEGYQLVHSDNEEGIASLIYADKYGSNITFNQSSQKSALRIDSESGTVNNVLLDNGLNAVCMVKDDIIAISWIQEDFSFLINVNKIELSEILKIADSIIIKK